RRGIRAGRRSGEAERRAGAVLQDGRRRPRLRARRHDRAPVRRRRVHLVRFLFHRAWHHEAELIMQRRTFLTTGGMAAIGFGVSACSGNPKANLAPRRPPVTLAPVKAAWDRIIRTTVGLRPHRDAGFVLKTDKLDDKLLVHNYGHGGAGMSLAWGTGLMAAEFATEHQSRQAAVIGCGSVGLTCARQLQRRGFDVTIYAPALPPQVTDEMVPARV